jgi:hypothetical protein
MIVRTRQPVETDRRMYGYTRRPGDPDPIPGRGPSREPGPPPRPGPGPDPEPLQDPEPPPSQDPTTDPEKREREEK